MPAFSGTYDSEAGLIWPVLITGDITGDPSKPPLQEGLRLYNALVDTGATSTCIFKKVASELNLVPSGKTTLITANGSVETNTYKVRIFLIRPGQQLADGRHQGQADMITPVNHVVELVEDEDRKEEIGYQMLIGRDMISKGILILSYDGHFSFSY